MFHCWNTRSCVAGSPRAKSSKLSTCGFARYVANVRLKEHVNSDTFNGDNNDLLVVLEVETNTWQVHKRLDASLAELLWVTDTRALENEWRTKCSTRHDDLLACLDDARGNFTVGQVFGGHDLDADSAVTFKDDLRNHYCQCAVHVQSI
jgi:hypothetical protein